MLKCPGIMFRGGVATDRQPDHITQWLVESLLASSKARLRRRNKQAHTPDKRRWPWLVQRWGQLDWALTFHDGFGQNTSHGNAHKERRQDDLREVTPVVSSVVMKPLGQQSQELLQQWPLCFPSRFFRRLVIIEFVVRISDVRPGFQFFLLILSDVFHCVGKVEGARANCL